MHFPTVLVPKRVGIPANIGPTPGNVTMANNFASMQNFPSDHPFTRYPQKMKSDLTLQGI